MSPATPTVEAPTRQRPRPARCASLRLALSWFVWGSAAFFYLCSFYLRNSPAVMTSELMRDFGMTAGQLGVLAAFFFYAYVFLQIPVGVLVDSWGARRLLVAGSLMAAAGSVLFGMTTNFGVASAARALTGAGTAVGWVVTLKLATHWFPSRRYATLSGLGLFIGNLGALVAQVPLRLLVDSFGWRRAEVLKTRSVRGAKGQNEPLENPRSVVMSTN